MTEFDFGAWDGCFWSSIPVAAIDAWCTSFASHRPGDGESVASLLERCAAFMIEAPPGCAVVGHAGWISAALWLQQAGSSAPPQAGSWPRAVGYGTRVVLQLR